MKYSGRAINFLIFLIF